MIHEPPSTSIKKITPAKSKSSLLEKNGGKGSDDPASGPVTFQGRFLLNFGGGISFPVIETDFLVGCWWYDSVAKIRWKLAARRPGLKLSHSHVFPQHQLFLDKDGCKFLQRRFFMRHLKKRMELVLDLQFFLDTTHQTLKHFFFRKPLWIWLTILILTQESYISSSIVPCNFLLFSK